MGMGFERMSVAAPKAEKTPEEIAALEKSRALHDAAIVERGKKVGKYDMTDPVALERGRETDAYREEALRHEQTSEAQAERQKWYEGEVAEGLKEFDRVSPSGHRYHPVMPEDLKEYMAIEGLKLKGVKTPEDYQQYLAERRKMLEVFQNSSLERNYKTRFLSDSEIITGVYDGKPVEIKMSHPAFMGIKRDLDPINDPQLKIEYSGTYGGETLSGEAAEELFKKLYAAAATQTNDAFESGREGYQERKSADKEKAA